MSLNFDFSRHLHPFTSFDSFEAHPPRIIESAQGVFIYDSTGKAILDGMSGLWCVNLGYGQERLVEVAAEQMRKLPFYNTFFKTTHPQIEALAHKLASVTPQGIEHFFFANSGSEAIDTAMRTARLYWAWQDRPEKNILISRKNAYHGSSMGGVSLGGMAFMHKQGGPLLTNICHIGQPDWNREGRHTDPQTFGLERARELEAKILEIGQDRVAAFFAEPIQGAGGVIIPPESYWPEIVRICRAYDVLLVSDEVICGFGRTGARFGCQSFQFEPDIMTMAKGLTAGYFPMSCMGISERVYDVLKGKARNTLTASPGRAIPWERRLLWRPSLFGRKQTSKHACARKPSPLLRATFRLWGTGLFLTIEILTDSWEA